ncbi:hypothetical protein [Oceanobacillus sp. Castelsardo]|uniref:hypothetical protein n=1 Tax=Oceanobacillus sp. Castelsardo TaxID=1851204 RepID=UPI0012E9210B|nr:hypothetical protein [Oceanobacillus sp. Castelsardo]
MIAIDFLMDVILALVKAIVNQTVSLIFSKKRSENSKKKTTRIRSDKSRGGSSYRKD